MVKRLLDGRCEMTIMRHNLCLSALQSIKSSDTIFGPVQTRDSILIATTVSLVMT